MKKALVLIPIVASLSACSTTKAFDSQASVAPRSVQEQSINNMPEWMNNPPPSTSTVVYATATAVSGDMAMADEKAKAVALGKICTSNGGTVDKTSKIYMLDEGGQTQERSEMAIRSKCRQIDVTGVHAVKIKRVAEGNRYRTYVLVALPIGEANTIKYEQTQKNIRADVKAQSDAMFREMDDEINRANAQSAPAPTPTAPAAEPAATSAAPQPEVKAAVPVGQLNLVEVENEAYKKKRAEALEKPGAIVGQATIPM